MDVQRNIRIAITLSIYTTIIMILEYMQNGYSLLQVVGNHHVMVLVDLLSVMWQREAYNGL